MKWLLTTALILSGTTQYPAQLIAQTKQPATIKQPVQPVKTPASPQQRTSRPVFVLPKTLTGLSPISGRRAGMGSRDNCPTVPTALTALVPLLKEQKVGKQIDKLVIGIVEGLTTSERPTFWFYVPYTQDLANSSAKFILQDSAGTNIYEDAIALPPKPSIIGISLPENVTSLEVGKTYRWYLKVHCKQETASVPVYVEGGIQRINLASRVIQQLQAIPDPRQKIVIYAKEGIWFDALTMLAQIRLSNPNDASVEKDWQTLLQSVNLDNVAKAPIVNSTNRQ
ncbi:hypothetical protein NIES4072_03010 [Nostoc commune NIES-4072]|uniref:DUF928 domain-containing protein n=1 Tax=Nostoc commune NIES-4072 TaxID=2005467 RepID=A0A2R5FF50_NOSCO|nr:DUF928 domain-containing protein [Nostoc commune]BBD66020.1 hypothetical protein NIES4070_23810 [Nostoc commune HK-02]GBG16655.1 hypothetical protein NIES4072_03010 [Nostoc commune NIES-4072]